MKYQLIAGPGSATYTYLGQSVTLSLDAGETSETRSPVALAALCNHLGIPVPPGRYAPSPPVAAIDPLDAFYLRRSQEAPKVLARWSAYNHRKLESGEWSAEDFRTFMGMIGHVVVALVATGWGAAIDAIVEFDHVLATPVAKMDYLRILAEFEPGLAIPNLLVEE
jgi:hypothetical protein